METSFDDIALAKAKRRAVWALAAVGAIAGILRVVRQSPGDWNLMVQVFASFSLGVCVLEWCRADARQRRELLTGGRKGILLLVPVLGVPIYFISSRGFVGGVKGGFGIPLFLLWFSAFFFSFVVGAAVLGKLQ